MPGNTATQFGRVVSLVSVVFSITTTRWVLYFAGIFGRPGWRHTGRMKAFYPQDRLDLTDNIPTEGTHQPRDHSSQ